jgi:hypothetical protein
MQYIIPVEIRWSPEKNEILKADRGLCFEDVAQIIQAGEELDIIPHPTRGNQKILVVRLRGYVHAVPFVEDESGLFLKTIYPSRDLNKQYGGLP